MITIIDYGMGNLRSVQKALESQGFTASITDSPQDITSATKLILPGVGAFGQAMQNLKQKKLIEPIRKALENQKPLLGICLGFQLLFSTSTEHGLSQGLDIFKGSVDYFRDSADFEQNLVVPHMGWNNVYSAKKSRLFQGLPEPFSAYFVHSYFVNPGDKKLILGQTNYGLTFCAAAEHNNIFGVQFHPEKSGQAGLLILKNFAEL